MATKRVLAASGEQISGTETIVTSALSVPQEVFLPLVAVAGDATHAPIGGQIALYNNGTQPLYVKDTYGHRVMSLRPGEAGSVLATSVSFAPGGPNCWMASAFAEIAGSGPAGEAAIGAVATVLTANQGPTGSTAALGGWLRFILQDGTPCVVPFWRSL